MNDQELGRFMQGIKQQIAHRLAQLPTHKEFINKYCRINDWAHSKADTIIVKICIIKLTVKPLLSARFTVITNWIRPLLMRILGVKG